jgi:hypothetical protein
MVSFEYLPYLGRSVYIKYEVIQDYQKIESTQDRLMIWGRYSWSDSSSGPWEIFRWIPFGLKAVA